MRKLNETVGGKLSPVDGRPVPLAASYAKDRGSRGGSPVPSGRGQPPTRGDFEMRGILLAMLVAAGIGLAGSAGVSAAPINGAVIGDAANATSPVETVQH